MAEEKSKLRVAILTTETLHHAHFVQAVTEVYPETRVYEEKRPISARFETAHPFEIDREQHERDTWFGGEDRSIADYAPVETYSDINDPVCIENLKAFKPDAIIVFGTGKIGEELINIRPDRIVNLHGANPEQYVGIDTHLWAIYHRDFEGLVTTLHRVESVMDRGGVVLSADIPIVKDMKMYQVRQANTEVCIQLALSALDLLEKFNQFISRPQTMKGRRYSFMPAVLKDDCQRYFETYTASL